MIIRKNAITKVKEKRDYTQEEIEAEQLRQEQDRLKELEYLYIQKVNSVSMVSKQLEYVIQFGEHIQRFEERDLQWINEVMDSFDNGDLDLKYDEQGNILNPEVKMAWYDNTMDMPNIKWKFPLSNSSMVMTDSTILKQIKQIGLFQVQMLVKIEEIVYAELKAIEGDKGALDNYDVELRFKELMVNAQS